MVRAGHRRQGGDAAGDRARRGHRRRLRAVPAVACSSRSSAPACRCAEAYRSALQFTGKVVALVGVTLAAGVVTWAFSPIKFQADMGILLTFMFVWNMVGALVLIPALSHFLLQTQVSQRARSESFHRTRLIHEVIGHRTHRRSRTTRRSPSATSSTAASRSRAAAGDRLRATASRYTYAHARRARRPPRLGARRARRRSPARPSRVMDWDSHRYLECFFAVPMMGAVLHTVNVRLSPEQILYTINHAQDDVILVNADFLPIARGDQRRSIRPGVQLRADRRRAARRTRRIAFAAEYEALLARAEPALRLPRPRREHARDDVLHDRHDRRCRRASTSAIASSCCTRSPASRRRSRSAPHARFRPRRRLHADHADVPRARVGHALRRDAARREAGLSGPLRARALLEPHRARGRHVLALRADDPADDADAPDAARRRPVAAGR